MRYVVLLFFVLFMFFCSMPGEDNYSYPPPVGAFKKLVAIYDATRNDTIYKSPIIDSYTHGDNVFIFIGENHRSDGMPCLKSGNDLFFTLIKRILRDLSRSEEESLKT